jgi:ribonucleoside-diphosphate reductase alpha chain
MSFSKEYKNKLNNDIDLLLQHFESKGMKKPFLSKINNNTMKTERNGVSKLVMLDRYTFKDTEKVTLTEGDFVILTVKEDPKYPARGYGYVQSIDGNNVVVKVDDEFKMQLQDEESQSTSLVEKSIDAIEKPMELYYEQISHRNAMGLADVERDELKEEWSENFYSILAPGDFVPAGRVLYGAGSATDVTYFNCYVMPYPKDSRGGISDHRSKVMEIMSRGGGVGTNGSTLRPKNALARGVNGKSSGSVSWLDDIAKLTHLVEQGGSRRGAQMIMLADWHPDIIEFIISKMQNPNVLIHIMNTTKDEQIKQLAKDKLKFTPFTQQEIKDMQNLSDFYCNDGNKKEMDRIESLLGVGGRYSVHNPDFLTGANISVAITHEFMDAVENDLEYELRFPDVDNYNKEEMKNYNENWHECGDVREWEGLGNKIRTYRKIKAKSLWNLINTAATYSAEPGIFFIDNANDMTNAKAYGQKVVCTNPCGEQPLAPFSVCNLAAVNLANHTKDKKVDWAKLARTVMIGTRMQDNVIDATPYFLEENTKQALGERRVGMGVMGLHDLLIKCEIEYGSKESNELVDELFQFIAIAAYSTSINLAREKGSFPFLLDDINGEENFINSGFMKKMPETIREGVLKYGIRNSHLLTVAPTGSTGTMVNVSTGLEPYFSFTYYRSGRLGKFIEVNADILQEWKDANPNKEIPSYFISSMELSPEAHADTQCIIQNWIDSSISKTVNAPKGYTVEEVQKVYERLHKGGAKGGTVYVDGSRDSQVLSLTNEENDLGETDVRLEDNNKVEEDKSAEKYGTEVGDTCIICRVGTVIDSGGCNTCNNCNAQLKCGL